MTPTPTKLFLTWPAQLDLSKFAFDSGLEHGGVLLGRFLGDTAQVDLLEPNPSGPEDPDSTSIRYDLLYDFEEPAWNGEPERVILGDIHQHPGSVGRETASRRDLTHWRSAAKTLKQPYLGLIATGRETWSEGYPIVSWSDPILSAWVTDPAGNVRTVTVSLEPAWMHIMRLERKEFDNVTQ